MRYPLFSVKFIAFLSFLALIPTVQYAENLVVVDAASGKVLIAKAAEERRPVASLTKITSAMVVLDWAEAAKVDLGTIAVVPNSASAIGGSNRFGFQPGDQLSLRDALYAALISSDNIAALTLADHVGRALIAKKGGRQSPVEAFVYEMNQLSKAIGMRKTRWENPHGLGVSSEGGYSTASDMGRMAIYAVRDPGFSFFVKQKTRGIKVLRAGKQLVFTLKNSNELLGVNGIDGVKTGTTRAAGPCLVLSAEKKAIVKKLENGSSQIWQRRLISVVLNSPNRFDRSKELLEEGWQRREVWTRSGGIIKNPATEQLIVPNIR